jgi:outer membrane lipoprotein SlyB
MSANLIPTSRPTSVETTENVADLAFILSAVAGTVLGATLGSAAADLLLGGYDIAGAVGGGLAGCWSFALAAVFTLSRLKPE